MSTWFANPTTANKLRQSYLKGFLDISGGGILVRADNSLNFYTATGLGSDITKPSFAMDATNIQVKTPGADTLTAVPTTKLSYLHDLNENVAAAFADIRTHFTGSADTNTSALKVTADAKIGGNLQVGGNAVFEQQVAINGNLNIAQNLITKGNGFFGGNLEVAGSEIINMNLYVKGDSFLQGRLFVTHDASFHANITSYGQIVSLGHMITAQDVSAGGNLLVSGLSQLNSKVTITSGGLEATGDVTMHNELTVDGNASVSKSLAVTGNASVTGWAGVNKTLDVSGATALHSTLAVDGNTTLSKELGVSGNATVTGWAGINKTLDVSGAAALHATLAVDGNTTLSKELGVSGNATVTGWAGINKTLDVSGATTLNSTLEVTGTTLLNDRLTISTNGASITGPADMKVDSSLNFYVTGNATAKFSVGPTNFTVVNGSNNGSNTGANATVPTSKLSYIYDLDENVKAAFADIRSHFNGSAETKTTALEVMNDARVNGNLSIGGNAMFEQQVSIAGNLNIAQNLITKGNGFFGGNLEVAGNEIINMNLYVKGDTFLQGRVFVTQDASFHANIAAYGQIVSLGHMITAQDVSAGGNLKVTGLTTLKSKATITAGGLEVTGDVSMHDNLTLDGNATVSGNAAITKNIVVTGNSTVSGKAGVAQTLDVSGATALHSTLDVTQKATFSADVEVQGDMTMANTKSFTTGNLKITDSDYNNPCHISSTVGNLTLGTEDASKWVHITSNLVVDGSINFLGSLTQTNVNVQVSDELDISANGTVALKATQNAGTLYDVAAFYNSSQAAPIFIVGKNNTVAINKAVADNNVCFDVNGNAQFSGDMSLNSTLHVAQKITANGAVELTAGDLKVTVGHTEVQDLLVNTTSTFKGLATFEAGLNLGSAFIDQSTFW